jgi:hypothetical protein
MWHSRSVRGSDFKASSRLLHAQLRAFFHRDGPIVPLHAPFKRPDSRYDGPILPRSLRAPLAGEKRQERAAPCRNARARVQVHHVAACDAAPAAIAIPGLRDASGELSFGHSNIYLLVNTAPFSNLNFNITTGNRTGGAFQH